MTIIYGFVKCKAASDPILKPAPRHHEIQYHLHLNLAVTTNGKTQTWDTAINVGTNDADDLLKYKLVLDYRHPILQTLKNAPTGFNNLTENLDLPALDFFRSDLLENTGNWRTSDVMDGTEYPEPVATLIRLLKKAHAENADLYIFGRTYTDGSLGIHDVHMNQGSTGRFINPGYDNGQDCNKIWQDGALVVDYNQLQWLGYFSLFSKQLIPTDNLGNPSSDSHPVECQILSQH